MSSEITAALIGAAATLLVAGIAYWGGLRASTENFRAIVEADRIERREEEALKRTATLRSLHSELAWNARIIQEQRLHVGWAWVPLPIDALESSRRYWHTLPPEGCHIVEEAARALARYNALATYTNAVVAGGSGAMDSTLEKESGEARNALEAAARDIAQLLEDGAVSDVGLKAHIRATS